MSWLTNIQKLSLDWISFVKFFSSNPTELSPSYDYTLLEKVYFAQSFTLEDYKRILFDNFENNNEWISMY